jgi:hypothetical protein
MVGQNWPNKGELGKLFTSSYHSSSPQLIHSPDIYEGVHLNTYNQVTLHTSPGCAPNVGPGGETGRRVENADCGAGGGYNGCGVISDIGTSYGTAFNANGGGVYASLWTSSGIKVWYFAQRNVPSNIRSGNPDPSSWGTPIANYGNGGCDFDGRFRDMNIVSHIQEYGGYRTDIKKVIDTTFCGDWAGGVWGSTSCAQINPSCNAYVASQPQSFGDVSTSKSIGL